MVFLFFSRWNKHVRLMVLHLFIYEAWRDEGKLLLLRFLSIYIVVDCCRLLNIRPDRTPSSLSIRPASYIEKYFYNRKAGPNDIESFSRCCMACPFDALQHARQHISQSERRDIGICELSIERPDCIVLLYISPHLCKSLSLSLSYRRTERFLFHDRLKQKAEKGSQDWCAPRERRTATSNCRVVANNFPVIFTCC